MEGIAIRDMTIADVPSVYAMESKLYLTPWSEISFNHEIHNRDAILQVAIAEGQIVGYVCIRTILDETHVMKVTVLPDYQRRGIGEALLQSAIGMLKEQRPYVRKLTLEVRESNLAAIRLYHIAGFTYSGRRTGYYKNPSEDAIIMDMPLH
jgi:ribosomal-protein-alanine N-acetyltransferase